MSPSTPAGGVPRTKHLYDNHMHTPLCKHALGEPEAYADAAFARGLTGITVTCHNPLPDEISIGVRMQEKQLDDYLALVARASDASRGRTDVRVGLECDFWPGLEPYLEKQLKAANFSHVLGSIHPQLKFYQERYPASSPLEFQKTYFTHLALAAESGLFDTISHPDLVKNIDPATWELSAVFDHICSCLDRIAKTGTAMELNTSGLGKAIAQFNPGPEILKEMNKRGIPVVINSDAHRPHKVATDFEDALATTRQAGYEDVSYFLDRKRVVISIDDALAALVAPAKA